MPVLFKHEILENIFSTYNKYIYIYIYMYIYIADIARILENMPRGWRQYCPNELASEGNIAATRGAYFLICGLYLIYYMAKKYLQKLPKPSYVDSHDEPSSEHVMCRASFGRLHFPSYQSGFFFSGQGLIQNVKESFVVEAIRTIYITKISL